MGNRLSYCDPCNMVMERIARFVLTSSRTLDLGKDLYTPTEMYVFGTAPDHAQ